MNWRFRTRTNVATDQMIRYLLGELGEEERREVQERLFRDDEFFGRLCEAEDDLVDAWARGELDPARRSRFESHYLASSERRRKASAAEALARVSSVLTRGESSRGGIRMPSWALAAASVAVAVGLGALARETLRLREQIASLERRGSAEPEAARTAPAAPPVFTVFLLPGVARRAGAAAPLVIPGSAELVQMQLRIDPGVESPRFNATLAWASGARLWDQSNLEPSPAGAARLVRFWIPGSILRPGDYEVALTAPGQSQPVAFYYFSVR